ncbi:MAG: hypothetical protein WC394_00325 [Candidatus Omnitrophota bacterium]|jgi:chromosome segregation ATPase
MNKRPLKNILILLLAIILVFAAYRYISYLKKNIESLEIQKQNLLQEIEKEKNTIEALRLESSNLKSNLRAVHKRLNKSFSELKLSEKRLEELNSRVSLLEAENSALSEDRIKLPKAIIQELKKPQGLEGNSGFLIKSGERRADSKVKIEVVPVSGR